MTIYRFPTIFFFNSATTDSYAPLGSGASLTAAISTQALTQIKYYGSGFFMNFRARISANAKTTSTVFTLQKNGSNTSMTFTVTAGATGVFEDTTNYTSISNGDLFNILMDANSAESITPNMIGADYCTSNGRQKLTTFSSLSISTAATNYYPVTSPLVAGADTDRYRFGAATAGVAKNLSIYVNTNSRSSTSTFTLRVAGADTSVTVAISSGATGWFSDTTNTATIAAGDHMIHKIVTAAGTGTINLYSVSIDIDTSNTNKFSMINYSNASAMSTGNTRYASMLSSAGSFSTNATNMRSVVRGAGTFANLRVRSDTNSALNSTVVTARKNATNQSLSVTIAASTTGTFTDLSNSFSFASGDDVDYTITRASGSSGTCNVSWLSVELTATGESDPVTFNPGWVRSNRVMIGGIIQ